MNLLKHLLSLFFFFCTDWCYDTNKLLSFKYKTQVIVLGRSSKEPLFLSPAKQRHADTIFSSTNNPTNSKTVDNCSLCHALRNTLFLTKYVVRWCESSLPLIRPIPTPSVKSHYLRADRPPDLVCMKRNAAALITDTLPKYVIGFLNIWLTTWSRRLNEMSTWDFASVQQTQWSSRY